MPGADILGKGNNLNNKYYKNKYSLQDVGNKINKKKLNVTSSNGSKKSFKKNTHTVLGSRNEAQQLFYLMQ